MARKINALKSFVPVVLGFAVLVTGFVSCKNDPEPPPPSLPKGTLQVNIKTSFNGAPFTLNQPFTNFQNYRINTQSLTFLVHEIFVKTSSGGFCLVKDALRYDLSLAAVSSFTAQLDPGNYQGISFGIGIDSLENHSDPALYSATHPFSYNVSSDMHWSWNTGYIFLKFEGNCDTSGTGTGPFDHTFLYHIGVDELFRRFDFYSNNFTIAENQTTTLTIDLDVYKMFTDGTDTIDLKTENYTQSSGNMPLARQFVSVYESAFSVY